MVTVSFLYKGGKNMGTDFIDYFIGCILGLIMGFVVGWIVFELI